MNETTIGSSSQSCNARLRDSELKPVLSCTDLHCWDWFTYLHNRSLNFSYIEVICRAHWALKSRRSKASSANSTLKEPQTSCLWSGSSQRAWIHASSCTCTMPATGSRLSKPLWTDLWGGCRSKPPRDTPLSYLLEALRPSIPHSRPSRLLHESVSGTKAHEEVFLVMTPHAGPNTTPADAKSNFWRKYEFPTLERNNAITQAIKIINAALYDRQAGWLSNDPNHLKLPPSDADSQVSFLGFIIIIIFQKRNFTPFYLMHIWP